MAEEPASDAWPVRPRRRRAVLVVDVVESVRLMQLHEDQFIERWMRFIDDVSGVLPMHRGRMVKSLGDGLLLDFNDVSDAAAVALQVHELISTPGSAMPAAVCIELRCGIHVADVVVEDCDLFGSGVNLAARLATLANPGQTVLSSCARDELLPGLDADIEDLGECYLKHLDQPVHVYRLGRLTPGFVVPRAPACEDGLRAVVAVLPFESTLAAGSDGQDSIGDWIAEGTILHLSRSPTLRMVSLLSTAAFRHRRLPVREIAARLGADYVLSGSWRGADPQLILFAELSEGRSGDVVWAERITTSVQDLLAADSQTLQSLVANVQSAVLTTEAGRSVLQPPPNLRSYSLQLSSIAMMHRSDRIAFEGSALRLEHLIERHPRLAAPRAWLALWFVLRVTRGWVAGNAAGATRALDQVRRALDSDPGCSLALTMRGFVECHMVRDLDRAWNSLNEAAEMNPSDSLAWLFKGVVQSLWGHGERALSMVLEASRLSPLDPMRHYYDALSAPAALAAGHPALAADFALRSLRVNRAHSPTWRALVIAQSDLGQLEAARASLAQLLALDPGLTAQSYLARSPAGVNDTRLRYAESMRRAGLPEC